jgi:hypothetical protein
VTVSDDVAADVAHGKVLPLDRLAVEGEGPWPVVGLDGQLLAVYEPHRAGTGKPSVVLVQSGET